MCASPEEGSRPLGAGVTDGCERCELNSGSPEGEQALFTTEQPFPSLIPVSHAQNVLGQNLDPRSPFLPAWKLLWALCLPRVHMICHFLSGRSLPVVEERPGKLQAPGSRGVNLVLTSIPGCNGE